MHKLRSVFTKKPKKKDSDTTSSASSTTNQRQLLSAAIETDRRETDVKTIWNITAHSNFLKPQVLIDLEQYTIAKDEQDNRQRHILKNMTKTLKNEQKNHYLTSNEADKIVNRIRKIADKKDLENDLFEECSQEFISFLSLDDNDYDLTENSPNHSSFSPEKTTAKEMTESTLSLHFPNVPDVPLEFSINNNDDDYVYCVNKETQTPT